MDFLVFIYVEGAPELNGCTPEESKQLRAAMSCMVQRYRTCIRDTNHLFWYGFVLHMIFNGYVGSVGVQCGIPDDPKSPASTTGNYIIHDLAMLFNRNMLGEQTPEDTCSLAIHELMHTMGRVVALNSEEANNEHDRGLDTVYSCGRYCGFCSKYTTGTQWIFESSNVECFHCADSPERKRACGYREEVLRPPLVCEENNSICHAGLGIVLAQCKTPKFPDTILEKSCHKQRDDQKNFHTRKAGQWCCLECPSDSNRSNDMPCDMVQSDYNLQNTCDQPPPYCTYTDRPNVSN